MRLVGCLHVKVSVPGCRLHVRHRCTFLHNKHFYFTFSSTCHRSAFRKHLPNNRLPPDLRSNQASVHLTFCLKKWLLTSGCSGISVTIANMAAPPEEVDLGGDACIVVGAEGSKVRLKVSTVTLSKASQYFHALFGPAFQEGGQLADGKDIEIKEEDTEAFVVLCKLLHTQYEIPKERLPSKKILAIAVVADQYACVKAVSLPMTVLFPLFECSGKPDALSMDEIAQFIIATYLLDHPQLFHHFTAKICTSSYNRPLTSITKLPGAGRVPSDVWRKRTSLSLLNVTFANWHSDVGVRTWPAQTGSDQVHSCRLRALSGLHANWVQGQGIMSHQTLVGSSTVSDTCLRHEARPL